MAAYLESLHAEDLALAEACARGLEPAWNYFVQQYRPALSRAAEAIDPGGNARELADSLYADLFGLRERADESRSLFRYFHGRSSLATWLRALLAQRHVDGIRARRRHEPLPEDESGLPDAASGAPADPERAKYAAVMTRALAAAIAALAPRDRLRLRSYYVERLTLAAIGRLLHEHEATVSRHLAGTRREIRDAVERRLDRDHGLDAAARDECIRTLLDDPGALDLRQLIGAVADGKNPPPDRSKR